MLLRHLPVYRLFVLVALLAVVGCADPADGKPEAVVGEPTEAAPSGEGRRFVIGEGSTVGFTGSKITGTHDGGFNSFEGEISLVDGDPEKSEVTVTIDTRSIWSDNDRLTGHLKSPDFFDTEKYPSASFRSSGITADGDLYAVTGNLELRGVTKSITFPASITATPDGVTAKAEFSIERFDFKIEYAGKADDLINDKVVIRFDLKASPANG